uniref:Syntaxin binding protein 5 n=1 Tax=Oryzias melastigma TaxID=30732 RepID=A0A3B3E1U3_ORYME
MVLSGGLSYDTVGRRACLTVMHGKSTAVLEMDFPIVDFLTLCETPYPNDFQEPYAVVVLLQKDLVVIDLGQIGYPVFESPYPLNIHESPVTCCEYYADCPSDLIPALYSVGNRQKRQGYSKKEWPISGGNWGQGAQSYPEIIVTGHADGSIKFWDASALMLQVLYKLKTAKVFERPRCKEEKAGGAEAGMDEDPFAVQTFFWCPESRMLCVGGVSAHLVVYRFSKQEVSAEVVQLLEVRMQSETSSVDSPDPGDQTPPGTTSSPQEGDAPPPAVCGSSEGPRDSPPCLQVRSPPLKQSAGYQVELVIQLVWVSGEPPQQITSLALNSSYGLVAFGNSTGLAVVDYLQKTLVLSMSMSELYNPAEPLLHSPRKSQHPSGALCDSNDGTNHLDDRCKSPTSDARDGSSSRSRSSSVTSIDRESAEVLSALLFAETLPRRSDGGLSPCLMVGASQGSVVMLSLTLPPAGEQRLLQPVSLTCCGSLTRLRGGVLTMALLDSTGALLPPPYEPWCDPNASDEEKARRRRPASPPPPSEGQDAQYAVLCSEKQAKVVSMATQSGVHKHSITEASFVLRADVVHVAGAYCIACFCANGHIMALSLPSLRPLLDVNYLPLTDMRIARTFCFSNQGQALYLTSPTEIQRISYIQETCDNLQEMIGDAAVRTPRRFGYASVDGESASGRGFLFFLKQLKLVCIV